VEAEKEQAMQVLSLRSLALCVSMALLAGCSSGGSPASAPPAATTAALAPATLHYAVVGISWASAPDIVAQEKGFYKAENLTVETVVAGQSASACQQVLAKAAEIGGCSISDQIQAVEAANAPLVQVFRAYAQPLNYHIMAKPEIKTWADLKGKTIMVGGPKDNTVFFTRAMARPNGLNDDDYQFQFAGASSARYAALKAGAVDASILTDPFDFNAQQEGFSTLDTLVPNYINGDNYGYSIHLVSKDWAKDHGDEIVRYIRAYLTAIKWMYDPANKDELFAVVGPKMNLDRPGFDRLYKKDIQDAKFWSADGEVTESGTLGVEKSLLELGALSEPLPPPTKYYDLTWWKQAHATLQ
jgi:ABC-type nitrate/sulfonate/bicarbonate transport system substrate-binding protein